jgi:hypothetical protein
MIRCVTTAILLVSITVHGVAAQTPSHIWKNFVERIDLGTELNIRLSDGRRVRATLIGVREDVVLLQPKTRVPVPVQAVPYHAIVQMEPRKGGHSAGKAVAIGVATGVGVFFGVMALLVTAVGD